MPNAHWALDAEDIWRMGVGSLGKKQPRPALTWKPTEEEAGLDWIADLGYQQCRDTQWIQGFSCEWILLWMSMFTISSFGLQMGHLLVCVLHCRDGRQNQALGFNKVIKILSFSCIFQKEILQQRQINSHTSDLHPCENLFDENISLYTLSQYISLCEGLERIDADILKV